MTAIDTTHTNTDMLAGEISTWPRVVGIMALIYALGGVVCQFGVGAMSVFGDLMARLGGMNAELSTLNKAINGSVAVVTMLLGVYMLIGAIALLSRRRSGVVILRRWAVARLFLVFVAACAATMTRPENIQFQEQMVRGSNQQMIAADMEQLVREVNDDEIRVQAVVMVVIFSAVFSIFPIVLGFFLSSKKVVQEVEQW